MGILQDNDRNLHFWKDELSQIVNKIYLPFAKRENKNLLYKRGFYVYKISKKFNDFVENISASDAAIFVFCVTTLKVLIYKYCDTNDVVISTKTPKGFSNDNPLLFCRTTINNSSTFKYYIKEVKNKVEDIFEYSECNLADVLSLENNEALNKLRSISFIYDKFQCPDNNESCFDIKVQLTKNYDNIFSLTVNYNENIYDYSVIQGFVNTYGETLENIGDILNSSISDISVISKYEKEKIINLFNCTNAEYSDNKDIWGLLEKQFSANYDKIALKCKKHQFTYHELYKQSKNISEVLKKLGINENCLIGIIIERSIEMIIGVLAIQMSNGAYVPIEPHIPIERKLFIIKSLNIKCIITDSDNLNKIVDLSKHIGVENIICLNKHEKKDLTLINNEGINIIYQKKLKINPDTDNHRPKKASNRFAYIIHTSGSTGQPKGVAVNNRTVVNLIEWVNKTFSINDSDCLLFITSLSFDLSVYDIFGILAAGGTICIATKEYIKNPDKLVSSLIRNRITFWDSTPASLQQLIPYIENRCLEIKSSILRLVFLSGDWIPLNLPNEILEYFNQPIVIGLGGATEATIWSNFYTIQKIERDWKSIPYGKPIQNAKYYILDKNLKLCPIGVPGDLFIGGDCLALGYINNVELTSQQFLNNPYAETGTMYRTGDIARWFYDGNIEFLGRSDKQVKIRGYRIEIGEIENKLLEHTAISKVKVLTKVNSNGSKYLIAFYTAKFELKRNEVKAFLLNKLPEYMIPSFLFQLESFPLTSNGKIDESSLGELVLSSNENYEAPNNEYELKIVAICSEILNIELHKISINDNYFELGGDSLNAIQFIFRIKENYNIDFSLERLFRSQTLREISSEIQKTNSIGRFHISNATLKSSYELSPMQKIVLNFQLQNPQSRGYNIASLLKFIGNLDVQKCESVFNKIIKRHDSFRTSIKNIDNQFKQVIHSEINLRLDYQIINDENEIDTIFEQFCQPFDLSTPPLIRIKMLKAFDVHYMMVDMHHIIADGVSMLILIQEFISLYKDMDLPSLNFQYKDYAEWLYSDKGKQIIKEQEKYWVSKLSDIELLNLPYDYDKHEIHDFNGTYPKIDITGEEKIRLEEFAKRAKTSIYNILLAIINILLSRICNQKNIMIGVPVAGRRLSETKLVIGTFINVIPIYNFVDDDSSFIDFVKYLNIDFIKALVNQLYPYEEIVLLPSVLNITKNKPLFNVLFTQNIIDTSKFKNVDLDVELLGFKSFHGKADINFQFLISQYKLTLYCEYNTSLFKKQSIELIIHFFKKILLTILSNNSIKIKDIEIVEQSDTLLHQEKILGKEFNIEDNNKKMKFNESEEVKFNL